MSKKESEYDIKLGKRYQFAQAVSDYWNDVSAGEKYFKTLGRNLPEEERERILRRYKALDDYEVVYKDKEDMWSVIGVLVRSTSIFNYKPHRKDRYLDIKLDRDDIYLDNEYFDEDGTILLLDEALKYGYKRIFLLDNSTAAMGMLGRLLEFGSVVEGPVYNIEYGRFGVIINIEKVNTKIHEIEDKDALGDIKHSLRNLGKDITYDWRRKDVVRDIIIKYSNKYGLYTTYKTYNRIKDEIITELSNESK